MTGPLLVGLMPKTWGLMALVSGSNRHRTLLIGLAIGFGVIGGTATALSAYSTATGQTVHFATKLVEFPYLPLALAYATGGLLLLSNGRPLTKLFAAMGQMALSTIWPRLSFLA